MSGAQGRRRVLPDLTPFRESHDFRLLLIAGTVFYLGGMMTYVAIPFQIYRETGSNFAVGALGLVELVPLVVAGLWGGALADHADRRTLLIWCGVGQAIATSLLAVNALRDHPSVVAIFVIGFVLSGVSALQRPSREALLPRTVRHDQLAAANALSSLGMHTGVLLGPAIGGLLIGFVGLWWCYVVDIAGLAIATLLFAGMAHYPHLGETTPPSLQGIGVGLRYAASRRDLLGTYLVDIVCMLMAYPVVLFPALAQTVFRQPELLGVLYGAETVGALAAMATSGWAGRMNHHGRIIVLAAAAYGALIGLAGLMPSIWLCMGCFALAGAADQVSALFRGTLWSQTIPDHLRGRLAGIEMLSYSLGPLGGQVRAGLMADLWSVRSSIVSGGVACVAGVALTAAWLRDFWRYDARTDPHAVAERAARSTAPL